MWGSFVFVKCYTQCQIAADLYNPFFVLLQQLVISVVNAVHSMVPSLQAHRLGGSCLITAIYVAMPSGFVPGLLLPLQKKAQISLQPVLYASFVQISWRHRMSKIAVDTYV